MKKMYKKNLFGMLLVAACLMVRFECHAQDTTIETALKTVSSLDVSENGYVTNDRHDRSEMADWDLLKNFSLTSGGQQGVVSDGINIYTCSWQVNPSGGYSFYKYDMQGYFIEGFNITGVGQIRDLTYDGQYFYGSDGSNYLFTIDLVNKKLVGSVSTTCVNIQHCSYDPDNDGFWVGYWNNLRLINRSGQTIRVAPSPSGAHSSGYFKDSIGQSHLYLFCEPNSNALVYDYNITTNIMGSSAIFDFAVVPGYSNANGGGLAGGCYIGPYLGRLAFYGNVQQSPNLVGILELNGSLPFNDYATVTLKAGNLWNDGTGYQMLLDADANTFGSVIPTTGGLTNSGDASPEVYAQFEYKIPINADGSLTTQNIVINNSITIQIPAGIYDWCITNPTPGDRMWIAGSNGNIGGRQNDFTFESGKTYEFEVKRFGNNDGVDLTIVGDTPIVYDIIVEANPFEGGVVEGAGSYESGSSCTLTATPNSGYTFVKWTKNGIHHSDQQICSFIVTESATYVAHFSQSVNSYLISASAEPEVGGSVTGGGAYNQGATCILTAIPNSDYTFLNWTKNGIVVSEEMSFAFLVTENASYVAHFTQIVTGYIITTNANPIEGGTVTGGGTYSSGLSCTLTATPNEGYRFVNWTENGVIQWQTEQYEFVVDRDRTLVANFEALPTFTITAMADPNGTISPQGDVQVSQGGDATFTITANFGSKIKQVLIDDLDIGPVATYTFVNVNRNHTIYAKFSGLDVDENRTNGFQIYPNPADDKVTVEGDDISLVGIYDMVGCKLYDVEVTSKSVTIPSGALPSGIYLVEVVYSNGRRAYQRLVVVH